MKDAPGLVPPAAGAPLTSIAQECCKTQPLPFVSYSTTTPNPLCAVRKICSSSEKGTWNPNPLQEKYFLYFPDSLFDRC